MECTQVVPLLSSSPDELTLEVGRRPAPMFDETDELLDIDEDEQASPVMTDPSIWNSPMNTMTHENTNPNTSTTNNTFTLLSQSKTSTVWKTLQFRDELSLQCVHLVSSDIYTHTHTPLLSSCTDFVVLLLFSNLWRDIRYTNRYPLRLFLLAYMHI